MHVHFEGGNRPRSFEDAVVAHGAELAKRGHKVTAVQATGRPDVVLRWGLPFDLAPTQEGEPLVLWMTGEHGHVAREIVHPDRPLRYVQPKPGRERFHAPVGLPRKCLVVTPSSWSAWCLERSGIPKERIRIVPHGIDTSVFAPKLGEQKRSDGAPEFHFLHVSSFEHRKGPDILLRAFAEVARLKPSARLTIKTSGPHDPVGPKIGRTLRREVTKSLASKITRISDELTPGQMAALYQDADCLVQPFRAEGFCLPVLEAQACGTPTIFTGGGPCMDYADPALSISVRSHLWEPADSKPRAWLEPDLKALVRAMLRVMDGWRPSAPPHPVPSIQTATDRLEAVLAEAAKL